MDAMSTDPGSDLEVQPPAAPEGAPSSEDPALIAAAREERARSRMRQTVRDMVISMLVVAAAVALLVLPWNRAQPDPVHVVDPAPVVSGARAQEPWPVLAPSGLSASWRCTSARITPAGDGVDVVHLGYVSPTVAYVGLEQSATKMTDFVRESTVTGVATGESVTLKGRTWQRYVSGDGSRRSLVNLTEGVTYVVVGSAQWPEIDQFAASLTAG
jgi:hypothetical protein